MAKLMNIQRSKAIKKFIMQSGYLLTLFKILVYMLYSNHLMACFWYLISKLNDFGPDTWVYRY